MSIVDKIQNMFTVGHETVYILLDDSSLVGVYYTYRLARNAAEKISVPSIHPIYMISTQWKKQLKIYKTVKSEEILYLNSSVISLSGPKSIANLEIICLLLMHYPELIARYSCLYTACKNINFPNTRYSGVVQNFKKFLDAIPDRLDYLE